MKLDASAFLARFDAVDAALVARQFPPTSPWWLAQLARFVHALAWVLRVGRRGGKSSTLCRLAVAWVLFGAWSVPPGDRGVVALVSISIDEARQRLRTIAAILDALGVGHTQRADEIELTDRPAVFKVFACSTTAPVGFTGLLVIGDEVARWESRETSSNPASFVFGSMRPTLATQPFGFAVLSSSPWSLDDFHAAQFDVGDSSHQVVSFAPTWLANPTITEQATRQLEPHDGTWRREYAGIPSASAGTPFFAEDSIVRCTDVGRVVPAPPTSGLRFVVSADQAPLRDHFGVCVASHEVGPLAEHGERQPARVIVHECFSWQPQGQPSADAKRLTLLAHKYDTRRIVIDQGGGGIVFAELLRQFNAYADVVHWTGGDRDGSKLDRFRRVRTALDEGILRLPDLPELRRELRSFQSELGPSGTERIFARRSTAGHADAATALVLGVSVALEQRPCLPPEREMPWERNERVRASHNLGLMLGAYAGVEDHFPDLFGGNDI